MRAFCWFFPRIPKTADSLAERAGFEPPGDFVNRQSGNFNRHSDGTTDSNPARSTIHIWSPPACKGHCRRDLELGCGHISGLLVGLAIEAPALMDFRTLRSLSVW